jgi:Protein of unknown function (DUF3352)
MLGRPSMPRPRLPGRVGEAAEAGWRAGVEAGQEVWDYWLGLSIYTRRRLGLLAGIAAFVAVIWLVAVPALPCQAPGGEACPPTDDALSLVPADALAYAHLNLDRGSDQFSNAQQVASQIPTLAQQATGRLAARLPGPGGATADFNRDIAPWLGNEAALAIVPVGGRAAQEVELLEARDATGARRYAASIASGTPRTVSYHGEQVEIDPRGLATALVGGFLVIGAESGVRAVIDAHTGVKGAGSLAEDPAASAIREALPGQRLADFYLSKEGVARLVADPRAPLATFASVIDPGASQGAAAALVASDDGLELEIRSTLDPKRAASHPSFFSAFKAFQPSLPASLSEGTLAYLGIGDPGTTIAALLDRSSVHEPGLASLVDRVLKGVTVLGKVDLGRDLLPSLGGEGAFALEPANGAAGGTPVAAFVGSGVDAGSASRALADLETPVAKALGTPPKPKFSAHEVAGVTAHTLRVSPAVDLTYAIVDSMLIVATDPAGVRAVSAGAPGLDDTDSFRQATAGLPSEVSALGYLNLDGLVALGESAGLARSPAYAAFAPEIRRLAALGFAVQSSTSELSTDVRLIVG